MEEKDEAELQEAFVRKAAELRRITRELVDKNPAQYGRFSERVLEIIRRFEAGQIAAAEGLREFEGLTGGITAEQGAHADLGMDERAFSILRIMETASPDAAHAALQAAAKAIGDIYATAQRSQPSWFVHGRLQEGATPAGPPHPQRARRWARPRRSATMMEDFAVHAYAGPA